MREQYNPWEHTNIIISFMSNIGAFILYNLADTLEMYISAFFLWFCSWLFFYLAWRVHKNT